MRDAPSAVRHRAGRTSARGYYDAAYDFDAVRRLVLEPLGAGGDRVIATSVHDLVSDVPALATATVDPAAIVLFDCTFLQRGALRGLWDEVVQLECDEGIARARGVARDAAGLGGAEAAERAYERRYHAACRIYRQEERPAKRATVVVDNTDPDRPVLLRA